MRLKKEKKRGRGGAKGSAFEREVCKTLSLWWSGKEADDIFWRSQGSGSRATMRRRHGKSTNGQCGDICATDSSGIPLIDFLTIEIKKGYNDDSIVDFLDSPKKRNAKMLEWFEQVRLAWENSGSFSWALIHKRDRRETLIYFPTMVADLLQANNCLRHAYPFSSFRIYAPTEASEAVLQISCVQFHDFLRTVYPFTIKKLVDQV